MNTAPSFDVARETIADLMDNWVFGRVMSVKIPDPENDYYHGYVKTPRGRAWFQQSKRGRKPLRVGPIEIHSGSQKPRTGDLMIGRCESGDRGNRFIHWYTNVKHLKEFYHVCVNGTHKREFQLMETLRGDDDSVWALSRLLLFGNVRAFADQHHGTNSTMKLEKSVVEFIHQTSESLRDPSIWDEFVRLVPDARVPCEEEEEEEREEPQFLKRLKTLNSSKPLFSGVSAEPISPPYIPESPPYIPNSPPESPPYIPNSPPPCFQENLPENPEPKPQMDIDTLSRLISQYCPPPVQEYDPANPSYDHVN